MMNGSGSSVSKSLNYIASSYNITQSHIGFDYTNIVNGMYNSIVFNECDKWLTIEAAVTLVQF